MSSFGISKADILKHEVKLFFGDKPGPQELIKSNGYQQYYMSTSRSASDNSTMRLNQRTYKEYFNESDENVDCHDNRKSNVISG